MQTQQMLTWCGQTPRHVWHDYAVTHSSSGKGAELPSVPAAACGVQ